MTAKLRTVPAAVAEEFGRHAREMLKHQGLAEMAGLKARTLLLDHGIDPNRFGVEHQLGAKHPVGTVIDAQGNALELPELHETVDRKRK